MKKIVFLVLTLLLLTGLCLGIGFSAMAAENDGVNALAQTIMAGYAPAEVPADAKPVRSYGDFVAMDPAGVYYLAADFKVTSSYLLTFEGELYGNGHTLTLSGAPMFTKLDGATVCDITFEGTVTNKAATVLSYVGSLTREAYNATIAGITNKAPIVQEVKEMFAGGISGYAENTTFKYCVNYGDISGNTVAHRPGGIMGECNNASAWVVLENCINYGTVNGVNQTGGLVSRIENGKSLRMTDCANFGTVNVAGSDSGGVIGKVTQTTTEVTLDGCYNSGTVNAGSIAGGVMGYVRASKLTLNECYNGCFVDGCDCEGTVHGYITQKTSADIGGIVAVLECSGVTEITFTNCTNYGKVYSLNGNRIGGIAGCMEGKTLTVSNCHNYGDLTSNNYGAGLFGRAGASAGVLTLENCSNNGNVTVGANGKGAYVGGLIGYQQYSLGIRFVNCTNNGDLSSTWNAGGLLCRMDGGVVTMTDNVEFINCVNNGDIVKCAGTSGGMLGISEIGDLAKLANLIFTNCQNNGDITFTNYTGGMTGIAYATNITMSNCTNTGDMIFNAAGNYNEYGEVGGLAGRLYGKLTATDCLNTGNVLDASGAPNTATRTTAFVLGGIAGRVAQEGSTDAHKAQTVTLTRCVNTGIIGGSRAIADAATTYTIAAGGMIGNSRSAIYAYNCVNTGDVFGNQQVAGICALSGQNSVAGHTYYGNVVLSDIYSSNHKGSYSSAGAAGLSCYGWGNVKVERNLVAGNIEVNNTGSGKAMSDRWACSALFGYTNNAGGDFKYNYFTGTLKTDGGDNCYLILVANTKEHDHTAREGNQMVHNYSVNQYNLHCNQVIGYSVNKSTSITPEAMKALLPNSFTLIKLCDGTVLPMDAQAVKAYTTALNAVGHTYGNYTATADPNNHTAVCGCGDVIYEAHSYDNACDTDCNDCGYVRFEQPTHEGAFDCSDVCRHCDAAITPKADHKGEFDCSTTCVTCGIIIVGGDHTVSSDCDTTCDVCGETVAPVVPDHVLENPCDSICSACGATVEGADHEGEFDCSETCRWCGEAVKAIAKHQGEFECSTTCRWCGVAVIFVPHVGLSDCATVCIYCDGTIEAKAEHEKQYACDTACKNCGEAVEGAHEGEFDCSSHCVYCGTNITPKAYHTTDPEKPCADACTVCGATVAAAPHTYEHDCSTECSVCGAVRPDVTHTYDAACDVDCNVCGETRTAAAHNGGAELCSDVCVFCGIAITPAEPCTGILPCSETCQWCGEAVVGEDHTYYNNCDVDCNVCGDVREVEPHSGLYPCSVNCQYCNREIAATGNHVYDNRCDADCNNCGAVRMGVGHTYDNNCDTVCNVCEAEREPNKHVYKYACDPDCEICRAVRDAASGLAEHTYDNPCNDIDCNVCGAMRSELAAHVYDGCLDGDCNVCKGTRNVDNAAHTFGDWTVTLEPTREDEGSKERVCSACGNKETEAIPVDPRAGVGKIPLVDNVPYVSDAIIAVADLVGTNSTVALIIVAAALLLVIILIIAIPVGVSAKKKRKAKKAAAAKAAKAEAPAEKTEAPAEETEAPAEETEAPAEEAEAPAEEAEAPAEEAEAPAEEPKNDGDNK